MSRQRDSQRRKVYDAEEVLHGKDFPNLKEVNAYVSKVTRSSWWKKHNGKPNVVVGDGRGRRRGCALPFSNIIKLPTWTRFESYILHELAHIITYRTYDYNVASHGNEFCKTYLEMVKRFMGIKAWRLLQQSFKKYKVKYVVRNSKPVTQHAPIRLQTVAVGQDGKQTQRIGIK